MCSKYTAGSSQSLDNQTVRDLAVVYTRQWVQCTHLRDQAEPLHQTCCKNRCVVKQMVRIYIRCGHWYNRAYFVKLLGQYLSFITSH